MDERDEDWPRGGRSPLGWNVSAYTPEMGELILDRVEAGETMRRITDDPDMPSYATVYRWTHVHRGFGRDYRDLRKRMAEGSRWTDAQRAIAQSWMYHHRRKLAGKPERRWRSGRRSSYSAERGWAVCERLIEGAAISEVMREPGMPSSKVIYRWLKTQPEFQVMYIQACRWREEALWDLVYEAAMGATPATYRASKARIAALEGRIGRIRPRKYDGAE